MSAPACPNCDIALRPVTAHSRSGYLIALDQCERCGGLWCDRWELFPIDASDVARLDPVDQPALRAPVATVPSELKCPRCVTAMHEFRDPVLPADAHIERCRACEGMWLNRGELRRFKGAHAATPRSQPVPVSAAALQELTQRYASATNWSTVKNLDAAASAPLAADDEPTDIKRDLAQSAGWSVVRALLQLLFGI
ncbi:MAG: zf-TFIIB domain-containing protein [Deltaproteobacteria bacterium]|nr:zf-TFIIB domain-containing protein [Deltaproteobacteria bacterium]MBI3387051.1 zf-TFIIB domain-containing protein [Deltaproteobacteria bacterium]